MEITVVAVGRIELSWALDIFPFQHAGGNVDSVIDTDSRAAGTELVGEVNRSALSRPAIDGQGSRK